jgi:hypothetical protein
MIIREVVNFIKILVSAVFYPFAHNLTDFDCLYQILLNLSAGCILFTKNIYKKKD